MRAQKDVLNGWWHAMFAGSFIKCGRPQCGKDRYHIPFPEAHLSSHYSIDCHLHVKVSLTLALSWWGAGAGGSGGLWLVIYCISFYHFSKSILWRWWPSSPYLTQWICRCSTLPVVFDQFRWPLGAAVAPCVGKQLSMLECTEAAFTPH